MAGNETGGGVPSGVGGSLVRAEFWRAIPLPRTPVETVNHATLVHIVLVYVENWCKNPIVNLNILLKELMKATNKLGKLVMNAYLFVF